MGIDLTTAGSARESNIQFVVGARSCLLQFFVMTIALIAAHFVAAQDTSSNTVRGRVVNALTDQPIARVEVTLNQDCAVLTDNEGQFAFEHVSSGDVMVGVRKPGYLGAGQHDGKDTVFTSPVSAHGPPATQYRVHVGGKLTELTVKLSPGATIAGQVMLSGSDPGEGIRVTAYRRETQNGHPHWSLAGTASTNSEGIFHVGDLPSGSYMLYTQLQFDGENDPATNDEKWGYPSAYYPGVTDPSAAGIITLTAGKTVETDLSLARQRFDPITARVWVSPTGVQASFQILDRWERPTGIPVSYDGQRQLLHADVPKGFWILEGHAIGATRSYGRTEFQVAAAPVTFGINILPIPRIPVIIRREFNSPRASDSRAMPPGAGMNLNLVSTHAFGSEGALGRQFHPESESDDNVWVGTVEATPGRYWIDTPAWIGYVASITSGGDDLTRESLEISLESSQPPIEIVLRNDSGNISGQIFGQLRDDSKSTTASDAQSETYIYAIPLFATTAQLAKAVLQRDGKFTISNLPPGPYRVVACDSPQEPDFNAAEATGVLDGKGKVITVDAGGTSRLQLDVIHMETQK